MNHCWQHSNSSYTNSRLIMSTKTLESGKALEKRVAMLNAKTENSSNESLFIDEKLKVNDRNNPAHDRKGNGTDRAM